MRMMAGMLEDFAHYKAGFNQGDISVGFGTTQNGKLGLVFMSQSELFKDYIDGLKASHEQSDRDYNIGIAESPDRVDMAFDDIDHCLDFVRYVIKFYAGKKHGCEFTIFDFKDTEELDPTHLRMFNNIEGYAGRNALHQAFNKTKKALKTKPEEAMRYSLEQLEAAEYYVTCQLTGTSYCPHEVFRFH
ncbi:MAG: hypothetical protein AAGB32_04810 [Pseudomonadota bacterium]